MSKQLDKKDEEFIKKAQEVINGLNNFSIVQPDNAPLFNKVTDMLELKIKEIKDGNETV